MSGPNPANIKAAVLDAQGMFTPFWFDFLNRISLLSNRTAGSVTALTARVVTLEADLAAGFTGVIVTAKITALGADGSMTFTHGVLTGHVDAT